MTPLAFCVHPNPSFFPGRVPLRLAQFLHRLAQAVADQAVVPAVAVVVAGPVAEDGVPLGLPGLVFRRGADGFVQGLVLRVGPLLGRLALQLVFDRGCDLIFELVSPSTSWLIP